MVYTLRFFSSKCSLFHNSNVFGSCIIHILYTECAKIKKIITAPKVKKCAGLLHIIYYICMIGKFDLMIFLSNDVCRSVSD